jgi:hypothetical protein
VITVHDWEGTWTRSEPPTTAKQMRVSIVIAVLDSHEVVRRQCLHFAKMPLPADCELIIVDDGSKPPLEGTAPNLTILRHHHPAAWTQPAARNMGCRHAKGEYLICTDIDHILTLDLINAVRNAKHDWIKFRREVAVLNEQGEIVQTKEECLRYGYEERRYAKRGFKITHHTNSFAIKRELYLSVGGVSEHRVGTGKHPNREEIPFRRKLHPMVEQGEVTLLEHEAERPVILMIPNGRYCGAKDFNPFGLFHNLPRKTRVG